MDTTREGELRVLRDALRATEAFGLRFRILREQARKADDAGDAVLGLRVGGREIRYVAQFKRGLRPATLGAVIHQLRARAANSLLVADHVTPPLAEILRAQGVEFIDVAGNAFVNRPPLLVFVKGQRPAARHTALEPGRAFQPTGLQVLLALLARPELVARPYREIAVNAGVAHGTVGFVMAELPALGYIAEIRGKRRLINGERLLGQWTEAYARTLRPRLLLGRFRGDLERIATRAEGWRKDLLLGGELAAARLTRHLRPETATFHTKEIDPKVIVGLTLRADAEGNVDFRRRFWTFPGDELGLAPTLLIYADLLAIGDARCLETAQLLRGRLLDRLV